MFVQFLVFPSLENSRTSSRVPLPAHTAGTTTKNTTRMMNQNKTTSKVWDDRRFDGPAALQVMFNRRRADNLTHADILSTRATSKLFKRRGDTTLHKRTKSLRGVTVELWLKCGSIVSGVVLNGTRSRLLLYTSDSPRANRTFLYTDFIHLVVADIGGGGCASTWI